MSILSYMIVPAAAGRDAATLRIVTRQGEVEVLEVGPVYRKADVIVLRMQKQGVIN